MNDEPALDARRTANSLGFLNGMVTAVFLYALTFLRDFNAREAIVIIFAVGMSSALLSFSMWERQALKDG
jgi:ABC-type enterobactin transport system permease subunit